MPKNVFGLDTASGDEMDEAIREHLEGPPPDEESPPEVSEGEGVTTEPADIPPSEPALDEAEPEEVVEEVITEEETTPYAGRYSSSYKNLEAFEEAHRNALDMHRQATERAKTAESQARQLEEYLRLAATYIEDLQKTQQPPTQTASEIAAEAERYGMDAESYEATKRLATQMIEERLGPVQQNWESQQQEMAMRQHQEQAQSQISSFRQLHADELTDVIENDMVAIFNELGLDAIVPDNYEIAYEAATNPQLREVLQANPTYVDTDAGMNFARRLAGSTTATAPASRADELAVARKRAQVESGNPGAPTQVEQRSNPADDPNSWEAVLAYADRERSGKSIFGV